MLKIFIFGRSGYLGRRLGDYLVKKGFEDLSVRVDVTDYLAVSEILKLKKPDIVINAAGKTGRPNIDWCESNREETMAVNINGALNIVLACQKLGLYMVHLGSGCVYQGDNDGEGFSEEDEPNFFGSFYSRTKIISEKALQEFPVLQLRIRIPISVESHPKNVINKLINYDKIISVNNSFTVVEDFLPATYQLIEKKVTGIYNMTNESFMDHEYLMTNYKKIVDPNFEFQVMTLAELASKTKAARSNTVLNTKKREDLGVKMPDIKERVPEILRGFVI